MTDSTNTVSLLDVQLRASWKITTSRMELAGRFTNAWTAHYNPMRMIVCKEPLYLASSSHMLFMEEEMGMIRQNIRLSLLEQRIII